MRNTKYRCDDKIFSKEKRRYYRCKNGIYIVYKNKKLCWCHYNKLVRNSALTIQKIYKGYRARRFINIYKAVPNDIQNLIYIKLNSDYFYKQHCNSIYKILNKRYQNFNNIITGNNNGNNNSNNNGNNCLIYLTQIDKSEFVDLFNNHIYPIYCLYNKYFNILTTTNNFEMLTDIQCLHILSYTIITRVRNICQSYFYDNAINEINKTIYNKMINSIFILNTLSDKYENIVIDRKHNLII